MRSLAKLQLVGPIALLAAAAAAEATGLALERMPDWESLWFLQLALFAPLRHADALLAARIDAAHAQLCLVGLPLFLLACGGACLGRSLLLAIASNLSFLDVCFLVYLCGAPSGRAAVLGGGGALMSGLALPLLGCALLSCAASHIIYIRAISRERRGATTCAAIHTG